MKALLATEPPQATKAKLEFAATVFGDTSHVSKLNYLMSDPAHFNFLREWAPNDGRVHFEHFLAEPFQIGSHDAYLKASRLITQAPDVLKQVKSAVLRALLENVWRLCRGA
jgi:hypothetical protein